MNAMHAPMTPALAPFAHARRWVAWRNEDRKGKTTKVPYGDGGQHAKADDPATWVALPDAQRLAGRIVNGHGGGIGIELGDLGDGRALAGVDLDRCLTPDGNVSPWARAVLDRLDSYAEVSPSGTGIKVFFTVPVSDLEILRAVMGDVLGRQFREPGGGEHGPAIELYLGKRYYAVTGAIWGGMSELRQVDADTIRWIITEAGPALARKPTTPKPSTSMPRAVPAAAQGGAAADPGILARLDTLAGNSAAVARTVQKLAGQSSRSEAALALAGALRRAGWGFNDVCAALRAHPDTAEWAAEKGDANGGRELQRVWGRAGEGGPAEAEQPDPELLANPDMSVLRLARRAAPALPLDVFGADWSGWISSAAEAAGAPPDYVVVPLLAAASALIGHARWPQAWPGWIEPPHLWAAAVGESGSSKSPGADCLLRDVLPVVEDRMQGDFPDRLADWRAKSEAAAAATERWKADVRAAQKDGHAPPLPPAGCAEPEPQAPRLRQSDVTIERVATLLAHAAPKGLLIVRDELSGWLLGMNAYNDAGRAFWIEAYGGRPYRVERQKYPEPIKIPRLAVAVTGTTQPSKLAEMFRDADDGLLARFIWAWPDALPFRRGQAAPDAAWAVEALDRLRLLDLEQPEQAGDTPRPKLVPLSPAAADMLEVFGQDMQRCQQEAGGLMQSAYGKARGLALRLSLVLAMLRWCASPGMEAPPKEINDEVFGGACDLVSDYFMPMAERVFGDAAATQTERNAATLARWIKRTKPEKVHVREMQRTVRLPGLTDAETIRAACGVLVEAGWLTPPPSGGFQARARAAYAVNPVVHEAAP